MNRQRLSTLAAVALIFAPTVGIAQSTLPSRLSDKEIWQLADGKVIDAIDPPPPDLQIVRKRNRCHGRPDPQHLECE